jgi:hypothetical protein
VRGVPTGHELLGRVVADAALDPAGWLAARPHSLGASNFAKFAREESVDKYLRNKLTEGQRGFTGNDYTRNGHAHEAGLMAWAGVGHNTRMIRHPEIPEFTATPDGIEVLENGDIVLGEAKVKHQLVNGPTPAEFRQVYAAQYVVGAAFTKWVYQALHPETHRPYGDPMLIRIPFDAEAFAPTLAIAHKVRAGLLAARSFERETR